MVDLQNRGISVLKLQSSLIQSPRVVLMLMVAEIRRSPVEVGSLLHQFQGFYTSQVVSRISSIFWGWKKSIWVSHVTSHTNPPAPSRKVGELGGAKVFDGDGNCCLVCWKGGNFCFDVFWAVWKKGGLISAMFLSNRIPDLFEIFSSLFVPKIYMTSKKNICPCVFLIVFLLFVFWLFFMLAKFMACLHRPPLLIEVSAATRPCCTP